MTDPRPIGLIAAIPQELRHLKADFVERGRREVAGFGFRLGELAGVPMVTAMAGIGKVNAALAATLLLHAFGCRALVFSGVAGGLDPDLLIGDVVVARRLVCHDYGALIDGDFKLYQPGAPPLPGHPDAHGYDLPEPLEGRLRAALDGLDLPVLDAEAAGGEPRIPRLVFGTVLTGDVLLNCAATRAALHRRHGGHAIEMEGAAVAQVAEQFGVPWVVVRALCDLAGGGDGRMHVEAFRTAAAAGAAAIVRRIVPVL